MPSGSAEAEPSSVTTLPRPGVWSGPAFATGRWLKPTLISTIRRRAHGAELVGDDEAEPQRGARRRVGAVNVGFCAVALESVTVGVIGYRRRRPASRRR